MHKLQNFLWTQNNFIPFISFLSPHPWWFEDYIFISEMLYTQFFSAYLLSFYKFGNLRLQENNSESHRNVRFVIQKTPRTLCICSYVIGKISQELLGIQASGNIFVLINDNIWTDFSTVLSDLLFLWLLQWCCRKFFSGHILLEISDFQEQNFCYFNRIELWNIFIFYRNKTI